MFLGLDFGTSSVKGVVMDGRQKIIATASAPLKVSRPRPGWSEQNPEHWWRACNAVIARLRKMKPRAMAAVEGIGLSGQQHGATLLDGAGKVLRPAILWNDARAFAEGAEIERAEPRARAISGNIALAGFTAPKLLWVKKHEPRTFARVAKVLLPKDYIRFRMTGDYASDLSDAAGTHWLDVGKRQWSDELLAASSMERAQMPTLFEGTAATGRLSPAVARAWGMAKRPVVAGGGGDNAASACGMGAIHDNDAFLSLGTSGVIFVANRQFRPNPARAVHAFCHAVPGTWHQMGVILSAAASLEWLAGLLATPVPKLLSTLGPRVSGPAPALFLPYLSGERTPVGDSEVRGLMLGLAHETDRKTLVHAVLDGVAFALRENLDAIAATGTRIDRLWAVGGGSRSALWLSIMATVLDLPIDLPAAGDVGGAFGAARLGLIAATGAQPATVLTPPKRARTFMPDKTLRAAYAAAYQRYVRLYPAIRDIR
ncbi:MAG TPA: xylulokinase [Aestuariivirga sp.]|nr:xylulokinase [Aestuariivirga sp.]